MTKSDSIFVSAPPCSYHRWVRYAYASYADIYRCAKCRTLVETDANAPPPLAARQAKA